MKKLENFAVITYLVKKLCHHLKFTQYIKISDNDISFLDVCQQHDFLTFSFFKSIKTKQFMRIK